MMESGSPNKLQELFNTSEKLKKKDSIHARQKKARAFHIKNFFRRAIFHFTYVKIFLSARARFFLFPWLPFYFETFETVQERSIHDKRYRVRNARDSETH